MIEQLIHLNIHVHLHVYYTGTKEEMKLLENQFINDRYTPFGHEKVDDAVPKKATKKKPQDGSTAKAAASGQVSKKAKKDTDTQQIICISSQSESYWFINLLHS